MDHAAPDAYAFLLCSKNERLFYSGDFRSHGRKAKFFQNFIARPPENIDVLLMEGTCLSKEDKTPKTESEVEAEFVKAFEKSSGINFVNVSGQNIDRLVSIYRACLRCNKLFVVDFYIANILSDLAALGYKIPHPSPSWTNVKVFFPYKLSKRIADLGKQKLMYSFKKYKITKDDINKNAKNIVMTVRSSMQNDIERLQNLEDATLIFSKWEGYKGDKTERDFLTALIERSVNVKDIHTSGHADRETLTKMVNAIKPKQLIPIHTFDADQYKTLFTNVNVKVVEDNEIIEIIKEDVKEKDAVDFSTFTLLDLFINPLNVSVIVYDATNKSHSQ